MPSRPGTAPSRRPQIHSPATAPSRGEQRGRPVHRDAHPRRASILWDGDGMRLIQRLRALHRRDDGFTLPELIITVTIIGIIATSLTGVVISYLKTTTDTQSRLTESHDVQFAAAYWQRDVASIGVRSWDSVNKAFPLQQSVGT